MSNVLDRRQLLRAAVAGGGAALSTYMPAWGQPVSAGIPKPESVLSGEDIRLRVAHRMLTIDGRQSHAIGINGMVPAPLIRLREGQTVRLHVENGLDEQTSLHWHGLIVPFQMDGVPGISFPGIEKGATFTYEFPVLQAGTYWYHGHSGLQEQMGLYGPIVIDPKGPDPIRSDREHVILLSDHSPLHPHRIFMKLKQQPGYFNRQQQTLGGVLKGEDQTLRDRRTWGGMRMDPTDIADVTAATYTYLVNGHGPDDTWTGLFSPGEHVRLRVINGSAMTSFNVRIPGLKLTIVQADGQNVRPVEVDEFQIGVAETYDVIVTPREARAYTLVGESIDRSGMARATLAPREGMVAEVPPLRRRPVATMKDMGMDMSAHAEMPGMDHGATGETSGAGTAGMRMTMRAFSSAPHVKKGPGVQTIAPMPVDRTGDPGQGLEDVGHRVLTYRDLVATERNPDVRAPSRALAIHLTGNMERYMWALDGEKLSEVKAPIPFRTGERVRVTLINDTMMGHPIHLHGHFFELVTGHGAYSPRKHTVMVQPGGTVSWDVTANAGDWAFHCHLLYHMHAGMMQVVQVRSPDQDAA